MTITKETSNQQVLLSAKKLAELGNELTDILNILKMSNLALEGLEFGLYDRLNEISFLLSNSDNAKELEA